MMSKHQKNVKRVIWAVVATGVAVVAFMALVRRGGPESKAPDVEPIAERDVLGNTLMAERMQDPEYVDSIHALTAERRATAASREDVLRRMEDIADAVEDEMMAELQADGQADAGVDRVAYETRVRAHPEWAELEARVEDIQIELNLIHERAYNLVRGRMLAQLDERRAARGPDWRPRPLPVRPEIKEVPFTPEEQIEMLREPPMVVSNVPSRILENIPPVPEREPVDWWPGKEAGQPFPGQR